MRGSWTVERCQRRSQAGRHQRADRQTGGILLACAGTAALLTAAAPDRPPVATAAPACAWSDTLHTAPPPDSAGQRRRLGWPHRQAAPAGRQGGGCSSARCNDCRWQGCSHQACRIQQWLVGPLPGSAPPRPTWPYSFDSADCSRAAACSVKAPAWMAPFMARSALVAALCGAAGRRAGQAGGWAGKPVAEGMPVGACQAGAQE